MGNKPLPNSEPVCVTRRNFLLVGATTTMLSTFPGLASSAELLLKKYTRKKVGSVKKLTLDSPVDFSYPPENPLSSFVLVKLGEQAGAGVGPNKDIVAFSNLCTHMGGPLNGSYKSKYKVLGPCPLHLTTFDLTRHGMVVSGHATESLPQAHLEIVGDDIYVTGVMGLIYGHNSNVI